MVTGDDTFQLVPRSGNHLTDYVSAAGSLVVLNMCLATPRIDFQAILGHKIVEICFLLI